MIKRPLFIYTMTAGLGDLVVLGSLRRIRSADWSRRGISA